MKTHPKPLDGPHLMTWKEGERGFRSRAGCFHSPRPPFPFQFDDHNLNFPGERETCESECCCVPLKSARVTGEFDVGVVGFSVSWIGQV